MTVTTALLSLICVLQSVIFALGDGSYTTALPQAFTVKWAVNGPNIDFEMSAKTLGYVALGFAQPGGDGSGHNKMDTIICYVAAGATTCSDGFSVSISAPVPDGIQSIVGPPTGTEVGGVTTVKFTRPITNTADPTQDTALSAGVTVDAWWAVCDLDNLSGLHSKYEKFPFNLNAPTAGGALQGQYQGGPPYNFLAKWILNGPNIDIELSANVAGYVSMGVCRTGSKGHVTMDTMTGFVIGTAVTVVDGYSDGAQSNIPDADSSIIAGSVSGSEVGGKTTVKFSRLAKSLDITQDVDLSSPTALLSAFWAVHPTADDATSYHPQSSYDAFPYALKAGAPPPTPPIPVPTPTPPADTGNFLADCNALNTYCEKGMFKLKWTVTGPSIAFTMAAVTTGYVSVGFGADGGKAHNNMDIVLANLVGGTPSHTNNYNKGLDKSVGTVDPAPSTTLNGVTRVGGITTASFTRSLKGSAGVDQDLSGPVKMWWAVRDGATGLDGIHRLYGAPTGSTCSFGTAAGCAPPPPLPLFLGFLKISDAGGLFCFFIAFIFGTWGIIRYSRKFVKFLKGGKDDDNNYQPNYQYGQQQQPFRKSTTGKVAKEKAAAGALASGWQSFLMYRIPRTQYSLVNLLLSALYIAVSFGCLYFNSDYYNVTKQTGYLCGANAMLVLFPATRNSFINWVIGVPFDHMILFHRWLGRFLMFVVTAHMVFAGYEGDGWNMFSKMFEEDGLLNLWGFISFLGGALLIATSLGRVRRNHFEFFFFSHYLTFFIFYIFGYYHKPESMSPYMGIAGVAWGIDRLIRFFWGFIPRTTTCLQYKDGRIVKVCSPKHPVGVCLGVFKVGQYVFVNFPGINFLEWHPYSVSSGPRELTIEVHIRGLGDHSNKLVDMAKSNRSLWVRVDGPYGYHKLNYRRYPVLLLVGGGVGITPVVGIIKDLYNVGDLSVREKQNVPNHAIEGIYVVWVMRDEPVYNWFNNELMECYNEANKAGSPFPPLYVWIYVTGSTAVSNPDLFVAGRPDFDAVFSTITNDHPQKSSVVFACGPEPMVNECWDHSVSRKKMGFRFDFHHETFEF